MTPSSMSVGYLHNSTAGVYAAMTAADAAAVWVMQGWMFLSAGYWNATTMQAVLHAVPLGGLIVLDLWSETVPVWSQTDAYYGTPFIWNMLHNFGGRSGLYGRMPAVALWPAMALQANASCVAHH